MKIIDQYQWSAIIVAYYERILAKDNSNNYSYAKESKLHLRTLFLEKNDIETHHETINYVSSNDIGLYNSNNKLCSPPRMKSPHQKAQEAKKSGKGLAHYRHTSFALSKPDAMNIVHQYIHKNVLLHSEMVNQNMKEMPNTFNWTFLFNIPEYVNNKKLLIESEIPSLPEPRKSNNNIMKELEETLNFSPDQYGNQEYSPDPFDIDDKQQIIEHLKNKIVSNAPTEPLKEQNESKTNDIDENVKTYTPEPINNNDNNNDNDEPITFGGIKHGTVSQQEATATKIISGHQSTKSTMDKLKQLQNKMNIMIIKAINYLDSCSKNKMNINNNNLMNNKMNSMIVKYTNNLLLDDKILSDDTPNHMHKKGDSVIKGGKEHRDQILRAINDMNNNLNNKNDIFEMIKTYFNKINLENINVIKDIINKQNEIEHKYKMKTIALEEKFDKNNKKYEEKILEFESKIKKYENDIEIKDSLINKQTLNIKGKNTIHNEPYELNNNDFISIPLRIEETSIQQVSNRLDIDCHNVKVIFKRHDTSFIDYKWNDNISEDSNNNNNNNEKLEVSSDMDDEQREEIEIKIRKKELSALKKCICNSISNELMDEYQYKEYSERFIFDIVILLMNLIMLNLLVYTNILMQNSRMFFIV